MRSPNTVSVIHALDSSRFFDGPRFREMPVIKKSNIHQKLGMKDEADTQVVNLPEIQESNTVESFPIDTVESFPIDLDNFTISHAAANLLRELKIVDSHTLEIVTYYDEWNMNEKMWQLRQMTLLVRDLRGYLIQMENEAYALGTLKFQKIPQSTQTPISSFQNVGVETTVSTTIETVIEKQSIQTQTEESVSWSFFEFLKAKINNCLESLNDCLQSLNESFVFFFDKDVKTLGFICDYFFYQALDPVLHVVEKIYHWFF